MAGGLGAGLSNLRGVGYVNVALQGILAVPKFITFLEEDEVHQKQCKTLLKCIACAFSKLWEEKKVGITQNPAFFVHKWKDSSCQMPHEKQCDPCEVLMFFIHGIHLEYVQRKEDFSVEDAQTTPVEEIFQGQHTCVVSCPSCGSFPRVEPFMFIDVSLDEGGLVSAAVASHFQREITRLCVMCTKLEGFAETVGVKYPESMIIHINECCPTFKLELKINLDGNEFTFLCCLLEVVSLEKPTRYICCYMSQEGRFRLYEDVRVTAISPGTLMMSELWAQSKITLIYEASHSIRAGAVSSGSRKAKKFIPLGSSRKEPTIISYPSMRRMRSNPLCVRIGK